MPERTRLPREARRAQLIESAAGTFLHRGYDGTSMEDVAQDAGVSRLIIYRIFASKHDLYRAVLQSVLDDLGEAVAPYAVEDLRRVGAARVILPVARAHPDAFRLLWRHALSEPEFAALVLEVRSVFTRNAREIMVNFIHDDELRLEWAARTATAHFVEEMCTWLDVGDPARDAEAADLMVNGIRALVAAWSETPASTPQDGA
jgi:AcrR family transcriptional regulator